MFKVLQLKVKIIQIRSSYIYNLPRAFPGKYSKKLLKRLQDLLPLFFYHFGETLIHAHRLDGCWFSKVWLH